MQWLAQHQSEKIIKVSPKDSRGVGLLVECGYTWINRQDGLGWRPISVIQHEVTLTEMFQEQQSS